SDLALAQITSKWPGFMKIMEDFSASIQGSGELLLDSGLAVRLLVVCATHQSRFKTVGRLPPEALKAAWGPAKEAILVAVNFLRSHAGIEHLGLLSSPFILIPVGIYALLNNGKLSPQEEKALLRWLFIAHMRGHYGGSAETRLDSDLA